MQQQQYLQTQQLLAQQQRQTVSNPLQQQSTSPNQQLSGFPSAAAGTNLNFPLSSQQLPMSSASPSQISPLPYSGTVSPMSYSTSTSTVTAASVLSETKLPAANTMTAGKIEDPKPTPSSVGAASASTVIGPYTTNTQNTVSTGNASRPSADRDITATQIASAQYFTGSQNISTNEGSVSSGNTSPATIPISQQSTVTAKVSPVENIGASFSSEMSQASNINPLVSQIEAKMATANLNAVSASEKESID